MTLPARLPIHEPRERSIASVVALGGVAILLWGTYVLSLTADWNWRGAALGVAVSSTIGTIVVACWYGGQKANAQEHRAVMILIDDNSIAGATDNATVMDGLAQLCAEAQDQHRASMAEIADMRADNARIVASLQAMRIEVSKARRENLTMFADESDDSSNVTKLDRWRR